METKAKAAAANPAMQFDLASQALEAWKRQFDTTLQIIETMTEGAARMREGQLQAAVDAHANAAAAQQRALKAGDPTQLLGAEAQWLQHNVEQSVEYWRTLFAAALETQSSLLNCLAQHPALKGVPRAAIDFETPKNAMLGMVETACNQWLEATKAAMTQAAAAAKPPAK